MNDMMSKLMEKSIYDLLSEELLRKISVVDINKNIIFIPASGQENIELYYILTGRVEVVSQSYNGRSFLIDALGPGEFVGKFSHMRKQNFYCEIKTTAPCTLLKLTEIKNEIMNDEQFLLFFYFKTSNRLYEMYKISMMRTLYTYEEILAYYLLDLANEAGFIGDKDTHICLKTGISERQYYYIMKKFRNDNIICQDKRGICIRDLASLKAIAFNAINFMKNRI